MNMRLLSAPLFSRLFLALAFFPAPLPRAPSPAAGSCAPTASPDAARACSSPAEASGADASPSAAPCGCSPPFISSGARFLCPRPRPPRLPRRLLRLAVSPVSGSGAVPLSASAASSATSAPAAASGTAAFPRREPRDCGAGAGSAPSAAPPSTAGTTSAAISAETGAAPAALLARPREPARLGAALFSGAASCTLPSEAVRATTGSAVSMAGTSPPAERLPRFRGASVPALTGASPSAEAADRRPRRLPRGAAMLTASASETSAPETAAASPWAGTCPAAGAAALLPRPRGRPRLGAALSPEAASWLSPAWGGCASASSAAVRDVPEVPEARLPRRDGAVAASDSPSRAVSAPEAPAARPVARRRGFLGAASSPPGAASAEEG